jgi:hypothetical protein
MTFEFKAAVLPNGQIAVPLEAAGQIRPGQELQVLIAWEAPRVEPTEVKQGLRQLEESYAMGSSAYDSLA